MGVWTDSELEFLRENYNKYSFNVLSAYLGKTECAVKIKCSRLGLKQEDKYSYNKRYFSEIKTPSQSYWLGFLYADGYVSIVDGRSYCVGIELQSGDAPHLKRFNKDISGNLNVTVRRRKQTHCLGKVVKESDVCSIRIFCKDMVLDLIEHGCCERKSLIKGGPIGVPDNLMRDFIRGYFDGNGSIATSYNKKVRRSYRKVAISTASTNFVIWLSSYLSSKGFANSYYNDGKSAYKIQIAANSINNFLDYLYKDSNLYLNRKYDKYMIAVYGECDTSSHK